jgi:hypothetical protein
VGTNLELFDVLRQVKDIQVQRAATLPLLVDEKVHYSITRLLYSTAFTHTDGLQYLKGIPLLYGCRHPYKHTVTMIYRVFTPVLGLLETNEVPVVDSISKTSRKVLFMEKVIAALLLLPMPLKRLVAGGASAEGSHHIQWVVF